MPLGCIHRIRAVATSTCYLAFGIYGLVLTCWAKSFGVVLRIERDVENLQFLQARKYELQAAELSMRRDQERRM